MLAANQSQIRNYYNLVHPRIKCTAVLFWHRVLIVNFCDFLARRKYKYEIVFVTNLKVVYRIFFLSNWPEFLRKPYHTLLKSKIFNCFTITMSAFQSRLENNFCAKFVLNWSQNFNKDWCSSSQFYAPMDYKRTSNHDSFDPSR